MGDDIKAFDALFRDNKNNDEEVKEAYRYAFRDFKTWNRTINYYRATTSSKTQELLRPSDKWRIKVRSVAKYSKSIKESTKPKYLLSLRAKVIWNEF